MNFMLLGIRALLFALSTFGYVTFLHQKTKIKAEFLPAIIFTGEISVLFLAGLLNFLAPATGLLFFLGLFLAMLSLKNRKSYQDFVCPGYFFFAVLSLYFLILLKGQVFNHYDNFSHWALVVKEMLLTDHYPTWQDRIILFQSYPLGSSTFIYFVCKIISPTSEGCQMFAQTMLNLSMILPLFAYTKKNWLSGTVTILGATFFLFSVNTHPTELLVDTLLPLVGVIGILLLKEELTTQKQHTTWLTIFPAIAVVQIKNSGLLFWALIAINILVYWMRNRKTATKCEKLSWASLIILPPFSFLLWKKHVEYVFTSGLSSPHSVSLEAYATNAQAKSAETISTIIRLFIKQVLSGRYLLYTLALLLLVLILCLIWRLPKRPWLKITTYILLVYSIYQFGNLCMYIFSMPEGEALVMAGYSRYYRTIIIWCFVYVLYHVIQWLDQIQVPAALTLTLAFLCCFYQMGASLQPFKRQAINPTRAEIEDLMVTYSIEHELPYLLFLPGDDSGYAYHLTKYLLHTPTVDFHTITDPEQLAQVVDTAIELGYAYIINLDETNEVITSYLTQTFGVSPETQVVRLQ